MLGAQCICRANQNNKRKTICYEFLRFLFRKRAANRISILRLIMDFDIYKFIGAALCVSHLALAAAAITFCILLFRQSRSYGWLLLAVTFVEPFYRVVWRVIRGLPPLWYIQSSRLGPNDVNILKIQFDIPTLSAFAVAGLFLLYWRAKHETPSA